MVGEQGAAAIPALNPMLARFHQHLIAGSLDLRASAAERLFNLSAEDEGAQLVLSSPGGIRALVGARPTLPEESTAPRSACSFSNATQSLSAAGIPTHCLIARPRPWLAIQRVGPVTSMEYILKYQASAWNAS